MSATLCDSGTIAESANGVPTSAIEEVADVSTVAPVLVEQEKKMCRNERRRLAREAEKSARKSKNVVPTNAMNLAARMMRGAGTSGMSGIGDMLASAADISAEIERSVRDEGTSSVLGSMDQDEAGNALLTGLLSAIPNANRVNVQMLLENYANSIPANVMAALRKECAGRSQMTSKRFKVALKNAFSTSR